MSDKGGYINDLKDAEDAMVAAGHPAVAVAQRRHAEAIRNMMQGAMVPMFVEMVERTMAAQLAPLISGQKETHSGIAALSAQFQVLTTAVHSLEHRMDASEADRAALWYEIQTIKQLLERRPIEREAEHQAILEAIRNGHVDGE